MQSNGTNLRRVYETKFQGECKTKLNQFWKIKGMNQKFNVSLWRHILILSLPYLRYLTHCWYSAFPPLIGLYSLQLYFSRHNCPSPFYLFVGKLFPSSFLMLRSLRSLVITSLSTLLDQAFVSTLWSWPKYLKPAPSSELFKDLNYTKLFMTFWSSNMLLKSDTTTSSEPYPTIVSRCYMTYYFIRCWPCFATTQQILSNTRAQDFTVIP